MPLGTGLALPCVKRVEPADPEEVLMSVQSSVRSLAVALVATAATIATLTHAQTKAPLAVDTARVTISGTSNIHEYTASTTRVRLTQVKLAAALPASASWDEIVAPGALEAFEIAIPAASLTSEKAGLDKNMHKALNVEKFPDITFRLTRLDGGTKATGVLRIAGVEREVVLDLKTERRAGQLVVRGSLPLVMTDYGVKPPVAMLGMLKTDPKVTVTFETVLAVPLT
jgi:polyisoprenoid-binding protein YceI